MYISRKHSALKILLTACLMHIATAFAAQTCKIDYDIVSEWGSNYQVNVTIHNTTDSVIEGYELSWSMESAITSGWNATLAQKDALVSVSNTADHWNGLIPAKGSAVFGFIATGTAETIDLFTLNGASCGEAASSTSSSSSSTSSSSSSSGGENCEALCNWYGSEIALCKTQVSGWAWENNQNCVGAQTCENQWGDGGIVPGCNTSSSSSSSSGALKTTKAILLPPFCESSTGTLESSATSGTYFVLDETDGARVDFQTAALRSYGGTILSNTITFKYANGSGQPISMALWMNGSESYQTILFPPTDSWDTWGSLTVDSAERSTTQVSLTPNEGSAPYFASLEVELLIDCYIYNDQECQAFTTLYKTGMCPSEPLPGSISSTSSSSGSSSSTTSSSTSSSSSSSTSSSNSSSSSSSTSSSSSGMLKTTAVTWKPPFCESSLGTKGDSSVVGEYFDLEDTKNARVDLPWNILRDYGGSVISNTLTFTYANGSDAAIPMSLWVSDPEHPQTIEFTPTGGWDNWSEFSLELGEINSIQVSLTALTDQGGPHLASLSSELLIECHAFDLECQAYTKLYSGGSCP